MSFIDKVIVSLSAGDGGDGALSFRREKFVDRGGPDGGDGGKGGDVIFVASRNQNTLARFRFDKELRAQPGVAGSKRKRHGSNGDDLIVPVPVGTVVINQAGDQMADLTIDGQRAPIAHGGKGGFGNAHFTSSTRQAPRIVEKGEPGEAFSAVLELKMIADVGLVGLPNAGKSTLLARVSNAQPEIANYPFTTLTPNLGVVDVDSDSLLFADIPGLIEGAAKGKGLGDEFLRHVERTAVLIHLIDAYQDDVVKAYKTIQAELKDYKVDLTKRPQIVVINKVEGLDDEMINDLKAQLQKVLPVRQKVMAISAISGVGLPELLRQVKKIVTTERTKQTNVTEKAKAEIPVLKLESNDDVWKVEQKDKVYIISGTKIERFAARTDFDSPDGVQRLRDIMRRQGIIHELERQRIKPGQTIRIAGHELEY